MLLKEHLKQDFLTDKQTERDHKDFYTPMKEP